MAQTLRCYTHINTHITSSSRGHACLCVRAWRTVIILHPPAETNGCWRGGGREADMRAEAHRGAATERGAAGREDRASGRTPCFRPEQENRIGQTEPPT